MIAISLKRALGAVTFTFLVFCFSWSASILFFKWQKLKTQKRVLRFDLIPPDPNFVVSADTSEWLMERMSYFTDEPERFLLFRRIRTALLSLQNLGRKIFEMWVL